MNCPKCCEPSIKDRSGKRYCVACGHQWRPEAATVKKSLQVEDAPAETSEQQRVIKWCRASGGEYEKIYSIPNEGKRTGKNGARMKAQGLLAGMPDLCLPVMRDGKGALYIEMKRQGEEPSDKQWAVINRLRRDGYAVQVCDSYEEALEALRRYVEG